jgi:hypothetical protein
MAVRFSVLGAQFIVALAGLTRERSWKALAVMFAALAFFFTVPRYLICCRCEGYGQMCYSLYMGKLTSLYLPKVEGKGPMESVTPVGAALEELASGGLVVAPAIGLRRNRKLLSLYLLLSNLTIALHFSHSCRHCAEYATDWRRECPSAKTAARVFRVSRA